jgi:hypothetical protein
MGGVCVLQNSEQGVEGAELRGLRRDGVLMRSFYVVLAISKADRRECLPLEELLGRGRSGPQRWPHRGTYAARAQHCGLLMRGGTIVGRSCVDTTVEV